MLAQLDIKWEREQPSFLCPFISCFTMKRVFLQRSMSRIFGGSKVLMAATKVKAKPSIVPSSTVSSKEKPVRRNTGLFKAVSVSPAMQKFLGVSEISRPDAVKRVWEHIKMNSLQNPADKKEIQCDEKLKIIFDGKDKVGFLEIAKLMSPHFIKAT